MSVGPFTDSILFLVDFRESVEEAVFEMTKGEKVVDPIPS
jgi:hypothetical protein